MATAGFHRRGATFVVTVAALAGLVAILASSAATHRVTLHAALNRMEARRAQFAAEAGIQRAMAAFDNQNPGVSTLQDDWAILGTNGADEFLVGDVSFRIQIVDAGAKINLNTASAQTLAKLPLTQEQVDCLLDWRSSNLNPRPDGAKDDYYHALDNGYNTKLRRLDTFDELLQVKNFTADTLYTPQNYTGSGVVSTAGMTGTQNTTATLYDLAEVDSVVPNLSPSGQRQVNINTATAAQLRQRGLQNNLVNAIVARRRQSTFTSIGQVLAIQQVNNTAARTILDNFAVDAATTHTGRVNLNTATGDVIAALPGMTNDIAQAIVSRQAQGFRSLGDLLSVPGLNKQRIIPFASLVTINSSAYVIRVVGTAGSTTYTMEVLLRTDGTTKRITRVTIPPYTDMTDRWGWDPSSNQITLGDATS